MPSKSKRKGNSAEYEVRDILTAWYGETFEKCPNSGALRWGPGHWHYGDLVPPESFPGVVEVKHHAEIVLDDVLGRRLKAPKGGVTPPPSFGSGAVADWWYSQTIPDADRATEELGKIIAPLLVWKQDYHRTRLCLSDKLFGTFDPAIRKQLPALWVYVPEKPPFMVVDFEFFLAKVSPEAMKESFRKLDTFQ